jgi:type VI secretion system protein ImpA
MGAILDLELLLEPVTSQSPGGPNLEYSPQYADLERVALGTPERQVGATLIPAEEPEWRQVIDKSVALLKTSKDLRIASQLTRALLEEHAFAGLAEGLTLVRRLVETYWPVCHPRLDADGDDDPTSRINAMAALTHRDMIQAVRSAPLVRSRAFGVVTLRDIDASKAKPDDGPSGAGAPIDAAFRDVPIADLASATRAVEQCREDVGLLERAWATRLESVGPDFTELAFVVAQASQSMSGALRQRQGSSGTATAATEGHAPSSPSGAHTANVNVSGDVHSREDIVRVFDAVCAYYARHEPSSPVPLLLERCKRLVTMSFLDIVKDMLPDGLSTIETIAGKHKD